MRVMCMAKREDDSLASSKAGAGGAWSGWAVIVLDLAIILVISVAAEAGHFGWKQGRSVICADSVQYVDNAEALLSLDKDVMFAYRKPGYSFILAGVGWLFGNMGPAAVVLNHVCLALLPLGAYGIGRQLRGRGVACLAAILVIAQLQTVHHASRIMSESTYTLILTSAALLFIVGMSRARVCRWMLATGVLLAVAWFIRSIATATIGASLLCLVWTLRRQPKLAVAACVSLIAPIAGMALYECSLNRATAGQFRTCTGTIGQTLIMRARYTQGLPFPDTALTQRVCAWLPERSVADAYRVNKLDLWVAAYRAMAHDGLSPWEAGAVFGESGKDMLKRHPVSWASTASNIMLRHVLRQKGGPSVARLAPGERKGILLPPGVADTPAHRDRWYAYWALPYRSADELAAVVGRMELAAGQKASFGAGEPFTTLRYLTMTPAVVDLCTWLSALGAIWPGFALLLCVAFGLNRRACLFFACAYLAESAIIGAVGATDSANERFQFVWMATDTALAAGLIVPVVSWAAAAIRTGRAYAAADATPTPA